MTNIKIEELDFQPAQVRKSTLIYLTLPHQYEECLGRKRRLHLSVQQSRRLCPDACAACVPSAFSSSPADVWTTDTPSSKYRTLN